MGTQRLGLNRIQKGHKKWFEEKLKEKETWRVYWSASVSNVISEKRCIKISEKHKSKQIIISQRETGKSSEEIYESWVPQSDF